MPSPPDISIEVFGKTDVGLIREHNEDNFLVADVTAAIRTNEIKEPRKTIPFAVVGGISIAAVTYLLVASATLGVLGPQAMGKTDAPVFHGAIKAIGPRGAWVILASAWMTAFSEMLAKVAQDGGRKRARAEKPPWWRDDAHLAAIFSHLSAWFHGVRRDKDSNAHPFVHLAFRALSIAWQETRGRVPPAGGEREC